MPVYELLADSHAFPLGREADPDGLLAVGGDLSPGRLLTAYSKGIFPWFSQGEPIYWWSPAPRMLLYPEKLHISKSMRPLIHKNAFSVAVDTVFEQVILACRNSSRSGQFGTWITEGMVEAYLKLHELGFAHSIEVWQNKNLIGGLYGISLGKTYFGESMFSKVSNASKYGFIFLVQALNRLNFDMIDCQIKSDHLLSLGAEEVSREKFDQLLQESMKEEDLRGSWTNIAEFSSSISI